LRHGVVIDPTSRISLSSRIVSGGPGSVVIARETVVSFKTLMIARDVDGAPRPIRIGERCMVGGGALIMPGVTIGDSSVVAAGAVVFDDVPPGSIVAGNPAKVLRTGIQTERFGRIKGIVGNEGEALPAPQE
jgi:acetyltransferase-like isoleucine patch superfamily enzyme